jgi:hypothetical protein
MGEEKTRDKLVKSVHEELLLRSIQQLCNIFTQLGFSFKIRREGKKITIEWE